MSRRLREEAATFANALILLTRVPVPRTAFHPRRMARSVVYFPLVGALLGLAAAAALLAAAWILPSPAAVVLALTVPVLLTGGLHEDGLADSFDSLAAVCDPERRREILKDSRLGTFGALALLFTLALKITTLASVPPATAAGALVAGHACGRWAAAAVLWRVPYSSGPAGAGAPIATAVQGLRLAAASVLAAGVAVLALGWIALPAAVLSVPVAAAVARHWRRTLSGVTGDGLGAACQLTEVAVYLTVAAAGRILPAP